MKLVKELLFAERSLYQSSLTVQGIQGSYGGARAKQILLPFFLLYLCQVVIELVLC